MDLSIIIVNYNTKDLLKQAIESVINSICNISYEIIVSDNGSIDGSISMLRRNFKDVIIIENNENLGFAKANNNAIKISSGEFILLLNSDTKIHDDCLDNCVAYAKKHPIIGALGCKVLLENGKLDHACKRGFPTPTASLYSILKLDKLFPRCARFSKYKLGNLPIDDINEIDSLTGAFMMVKSSILSNVGLLDEEFFMYGEDIDWCLRIKKAGYKVIYYPKAEIIHFKGGSSIKKKRLKTIYEFHRAMYLFYRKHYRDRYNLMVTVIVYIGIALRLILSAILNELFLVK